MAGTVIWRPHGGLDCSVGKTMGCPWRMRGMAGMMREDAFDDFEILEGLVLPERRVR